MDGQNRLPARPRMLRSPAPPGAETLQQWASLVAAAHQSCVDISHWFNESMHRLFEHVAKWGQDNSNPTLSGESIPIMPLPDTSRFTVDGRPMMIAESFIAIEELFEDVHTEGKLRWEELLTISSQLVRNLTDLKDVPSNLRPNSILRYDPVVNGMVWQTFNGLGKVIPGLLEELEYEGPGPRQDHSVLKVVSGVLEYRPIEEVRDTPVYREAGAGTISIADVSSYGGIIITDATKDIELHPVIGGARYCIKNISPTETATLLVISPHLLEGSLASQTIVPGETKNLFFDDVEWRVIPD